MIKLNGYIFCRKNITLRISASVAAFFQQLIKIYFTSRRLFVKYVYYEPKTILDGIDRAGVEEEIGCMAVGRTEGGENDARGDVPECRIHELRSPINRKTAG